MLPITTGAKVIDGMTRMIGKQPISKEAYLS
jgi:hypothetical protein